MVSQLMAFIQYKIIHLINERFDQILVEVEVYEKQLKFGYYILYLFVFNCN